MQEPAKKSEVTGHDAEVSPLIHSNRSADLSSINHTLRGSQIE